MKPGGDRVPVSHRARRTDEGQERGLKCILGIGFIPQQMPAHRPDYRAVTAQQLREGKLIPRAYEAVEKLGIGYDVLKQHNPAVIYATVKGFGTTGPYKDFKCFDWVAQAAGGAFSVTGEADRGPMRPGPTYADTGTGMHAAMGILAAYIERLKTGEGQVVEVSMQETVVNFMKMQMSTKERHLPGPIPRTGARFVPTATLFPCAPGGPNDYIFIMVVTDRMWDDLILAIDRPDLAADERFDSWLARSQNADALEAEIGAWSRQRTKWEAMEYLGKRSVPVSAVYDSNDIFDNPHLEARGAIVTHDHATRGPIRLPANPVRLSRSDVKVRPAPLLGQHTAEVLEAELGLTPDAFAALATRNIVGMPGD